MTSYLERLDILDRDVVTIQSDIGNIQSNTLVLQSNVATMTTELAVANITVTTNGAFEGNLILQSANGNAYYLVVSDLGALSTIAVT